MLSCGSNFHGRTHLPCGLLVSLAGVCRPGSIVIGHRECWDNGPQRGRLPSSSSPRASPCSPCASRQAHPARKSATGIRPTPQGPKSPVWIASSRRQRKARPFSSASSADCAALSTIRRRSSRMSSGLCVCYPLLSLDYDCCPEFVGWMVLTGCWGR